METPFTITVLHQGEEKELAGRLRVSAYTRQFLFRIGESELILEQDDEGRFRAVLPPESAGRKMDPSLVKTLMEEMEKVMKAE
jgi:hypothetical protein